MMGGTMGNDETDDKRKGEVGRESFETMPPELRPYYVPSPDHSIDVSQNPRLAAALATIEMLDEMEEEERREAAANGSTKAHVAPISVPKASRPRSETPAARVEVSMPVLVGVMPRKLPPREKKPWLDLPENKPIGKTQVVRIDRERLAEYQAEHQAKHAPSSTEPQAAREATPISEGDDPTLVKRPPPPSPWTKQAQDDVRASALPSSLRPRELPADGDTPTGVKPANVGGNWKIVAALGLAVILIAAIVIGARMALTQRMPSGAVTAPVATMVAVPTMTAPTPTVVPVEAATSSTAEPTPTSAPIAPAIMPRPKQRTQDDPYSDASAPSSAVTVQPQAPTATPSTTTAPVAPPPKAPIPPTSNSSFVLPD